MTVAFALPGETKAVRSKSVKNVRRHAASMFIKLCRLCPAALLVGFVCVFLNYCIINIDCVDFSAFLLLFGWKGHMCVKSTDCFFFFLSLFHQENGLEPGGMTRSLSVG